jgi:hypothetical protein
MDDWAIERTGAREVPVTALDRLVVLPAVSHAMALAPPRAPPDFRPRPTAVEALAASRIEIATELPKERKDFRFREDEEWPTYRTCSA